MKDWSLKMVGQGCEIYFICESFRGLHFTLFSSFPVSIKPLQSAMLWCTLLHVLLKLHDFMVLVPFPKGEGSHLFLILLILFLVLKGGCPSYQQSLRFTFCCNFLFLGCATIQDFAPVVVMVLTYVCEIIIHCVWPHHHSVKKYSIFMHFSASGSKAN